MSDQKNPNVLTGDEIARHNTRESCWVVVHGKAYDVTEFLPGRSWMTFELQIGESAALT